MSNEKSLLIKNIKNQINDTNVLYMLERYIIKNLKEIIFHNICV